MLDVCRNVEERPVPVLKDGFTLVRMHSAAINQLSNTIRKGEFGALALPLVLGGEASGEVAESGRFKPGTRVAIYGGSELGISQDGLFQQWVLVEDKRILELPITLNWDKGSALTVSYLTAYLALTRTAKVQRGRPFWFQVLLALLVMRSYRSPEHWVASRSPWCPAQTKAERLRAADEPSVIDLSSQDLGDFIHMSIIYLFLLAAAYCRF